MVQSLVRARVKAALGWLLLGLLTGCTVGVRAGANVEAELQAPAWPQPVFNVLKFGATGDGLTKDTLAIQAAFKVFIRWLSCALSSLHECLFFAFSGCRGSWRWNCIVTKWWYFPLWGVQHEQVPLILSLTEGFQLLILSFSPFSNTTLVIEKGAVLLGSTDSFDYPLVPPLPWFGGGSDYEQSGAPEYSALISARNVQLLRITGGGTIDGQGILSAIFKIPFIYLLY